MSVFRWWNKADSLSKAWEILFQAPASPHVATLALSVAEHETRCGDAWPGEHNWGGIQKRTLSANEKRVLESFGLFAQPSNVMRAREVLLHTGVIEPNAALHVDSTPGPTGPRYYWIYFWAFGSDVDGAKRFLHVLADIRPQCREIFESAKELSKLDESTRLLARAMYETHYYEGFHDPHKPGGADANVADYAKALDRYWPSISSALLEWSPGRELESNKLDLLVTWDQQETLRRLGHEIEVDGIIGPQSRYAICAFQQSRNLVVDGVIGTETRLALRDALTVRPQA